MKIKNLKINHKAVSKLTTCVLVGSFCATTLTGCTDRKSILDGTILENTCVVTFDNNSMDVAVSVESCRDRKYSHYYSVISGDYFVSEDCSASMINNTVVHHYSIINEENITRFVQ